MKFTGYLNIQIFYLGHCRSASDKSGKLDRAHWHDEAECLGMLVARSQGRMEDSGWCSKNFVDSGFCRQDADIAYFVD